MSTYQFTSKEEIEFALSAIQIEGKCEACGEEKTIYSDLTSAKCADCIWREQEQAKQVKTEGPVEVTHGPEDL